MRRYSASDPFARALLSGFIASAAMQLAFAICCGAVLLLATSREAGPASGWFQSLANSGLVDLTRPALHQAIGLYFLVGLLWAVVYTHLVQYRLSGPHWERGLLFASLPWLFSVLILLPFAGAGPLGLWLGAGPLPLIGSLALHALYGVTLAVLSSSFGDGVLARPRSGEAQVIALQNAEFCAALGVVGGLALGAALGLLLTNANQAWLGMHPFGLVAASSVTGGALGGLVGSFFGLGRAEAYLK
jgi:hypothetical protein